MTNMIWPDEAVKAAAQRLGDGNDWPLYLKDAEEILTAAAEAMIKAGVAREGYGTIYGTEMLADTASSGALPHHFPALIIRLLRE